MAVLIKDRAQCIDQLGALTDKAFPASKQDGPGLLPLGLRFDEAHLWPLRRDHNCFGISRVVLLALYEGFHVLWSDQLHLMAELDHFSRPTMRAATGFHHHYSRWLLRYEFPEPGPGQSFTELHRSRH